MAKFRLFFQKRDVYTFMSIILICLMLIFVTGVNKKKSVAVENTAVVTVDGQIIAKFPLSNYSSEKPVDISLKRYGINIVLRLQNSHIQVLSSDCHDKVCINAGILEKENDMAVCLPNKTSVVIYTTEEANKLD